MPLHSALYTFLPLLAALGSLLFLFSRRSRPTLVTPRGAFPLAPCFSASMQNPDAATGKQSVLNPAATNTPFPPSAGGELILLIDDEVTVRNLLSTVLLNHGYQVAIAHDGMEGLRLFSAMPDQVSLVLSDVSMPYISGRSLADLIRRIRPDVRILLMSGLDGSEGGGTGVEAFRDPFLLKPFKPAALLQKIHQLLHPGVSSGS